MKLSIRRFSSLKAKLLLAGLCSVAVGILVVWFASRSVMTDALEDSTENQLRANYAAARASLLEFHESRWREVGALAHAVGRLVEEGDESKVGFVFESYRAEMPHFSEFFLVDTHGQILQSTAAGREGSEMARRYALRAIEGGATRYLDGPFADPLTQALGPTTSSYHDSITLLYAQAIMSSEGHIATLFARVPNDVHSDSIQIEDAELFPKTGDTFVFMVDSAHGVGAGTVLTRSRFEDGSMVRGLSLKDGIESAGGDTVSVSHASELELVLKDPQSGAFTGAVGRVISEGSVAVVDKDGYLDFRQTPAVAIGGAIEVPGSPDSWALLSKADVDEAYGPVAETSLLFGELALATIVLASGFLAIIVVRPMNNLSKLMNRIEASSRSVAAISGSIGRSARSLSGSATDQAAAISETMASMAEITSMVSSNTEAAREALEIARDSSDAATNGTEVVSQLTDSMNSIAQKNNELSTVVNIIENISDKTKVINDIVFETKLLSFNASIEAARAGEQGKGFAVVAEEVGNLARLSGKAAEEIGALLEQSTKQVTAMVTVTKDGITEGIAVANRCRDSFENIHGGVQKVAEMMDTIALSSSEQQQGIDQVSKAMAQMDDLTQSTAAAATDAAQQGTELRSQGERLHAVVDGVQRLIHGQKNGGGSTGLDVPGADLLADADGGASNDEEYDAVASGMAEVPDHSDAAFG